MAMTSCKECGKAVSSAALACPGCGIRSPALSQDQKEHVAKRAVFARKRALAGVAFFGGLAWLMVAALDSKDTFVAALGPAKWLIAAAVAWYVFVEIERNLYEKQISK